MTADPWRGPRAIVALIATAIVVAVVAATVTVAVGRDGRAAGTVVVDDLAVRTGYVANPGMGWQDTRTRRPRFEQTVEYLRPTVGWAGLNPAPGVYDWSIVDDALAAADRRGHRASLRIYSMRHPRPGGHRIPTWVLDAGATLIDGEPDYSNAVYQDRWATFVEALRRRYDGDPRLAFLDISGYGDFNEWSWQDQTRWERRWRRPATLDGQARTRLADMFLGGSGTVTARTAGGGTATVRYRYPGFHHTQLLMPYAGIRQSLWYALDRRPDVGWRHDCLGRISAATVRSLGDAAIRRWRTAPVVFEFCTTVDWSEVDEVVRLTRPVMVHDNGTHDPEVTGLLARVGYRYGLDRARWPATARPGAPFAVTMTWRNRALGIAYPSLGVVPRLRLGLLRSDGTPVHTWRLRDDVADWLPGAPVPVSAQVEIPADVDAGTYTLATSIVDDGSGRPLSLPMRRTRDDGWFPMGTIHTGGQR